MAGPSGKHCCLVGTLGQRCLLCDAYVVIMREAVAPGRGLGFPDQERTHHSSELPHFIAFCGTVTLTDQR